VRPANPEDSVTPAAYLLFYKRRSDSPLGGNTAKVVAEYLAQEEEERKKSEETPRAGEEDQSSSSTASPKSDAEDPTSSSSFALTNGMSKPYKPKLLGSPTYSTIQQQGLAASWSGGWSNRAKSGVVDTSSLQNLISMDAEQPLDMQPEIEVLGMEITGEDDVEVISAGPDVTPADQK
jgi:hypothetical protein